MIGPEPLRDDGAPLQAVEGAGVEDDTAFVVPQPDALAVGEPERR